MAAGGTPLLIMDFFVTRSLLSKGLTVCFLLSVQWVSLCASEPNGAEQLDELAPWTSGNVWFTEGAGEESGVGQSLDELGAFNADELGAYGFSESLDLRNGSLALVPWDAYNVSSVGERDAAHTVLFGASDSLLRDGFPLSIHNVETKKAHWYNAGDIRFRYSDGGGHRASADYNKVVIDEELAVRLCVLDRAEKLDGYYPAIDDRRAYLAWSYLPGFFNGGDRAFEVTGSFEKGKRSTYTRYVWDLGVYQNWDDLDFDVFEIAVAHDFWDRSAGYRLSYSKQSNDRHSRYVHAYGVSEGDRNESLSNARIEAYWNLAFERDGEERGIGFLGNQEFRVGYLSSEKESWAGEYLEALPEFGAFDWSWQGSWKEGAVQLRYLGRNDSDDVPEFYRFGSPVLYPAVGDDLYLAGGFEEKSVRVNLTKLFWGSLEEVGAELSIYVREDVSTIPISDWYVTDEYNRSLWSTDMESRELGVNWTSQDKKWSATLAWLPAKDYQTVDNPSYEVALSENGELEEILMRAAWQAGDFESGDESFIDPSPAAFALGYANGFDYLREVAVPAWREFESGLWAEFPLVQNWYLPDYPYGPGGGGYPRVNISRRTIIRSNETVSGEGRRFRIEGRPNDSWRVSLDYRDEAFLSEGEIREGYVSLMDFLESEMTGPMLEYFDYVCGGNLSNVFDRYEDEKANLHDRYVKRTKATFGISCRDLEGSFAGWSGGANLRYSRTRSSGGEWTFEAEFPERVESYTTADFWVEYAKEIRGLDWSLQLNVYDLLDEEVDRFYARERNWALTSRVRF